MGLAGVHPIQWTCGVVAAPQELLSVVAAAASVAVVQAAAVVAAWPACAAGETVAAVASVHWTAGSYRSAPDAV